MSWNDCPLCGSELITQEEFESNQPVPGAGCDLSTPTICCPNLNSFGSSVWSGSVSHYYVSIDNVPDHQLLECIYIDKYRLIRNIYLYSISEYQENDYVNLCSVNKPLILNSYSEKYLLSKINKILLLL